MIAPGVANERSTSGLTGRVNSLRRLRYAAAMGCASADGTYLVFGPDTNLPKALGWVRIVRTQGSLFSFGGDAA